MKKQILKLIIFGLYLIVLCEGFSFAFYYFGKGNFLFIEDLLSKADYKSFPGVHGNIYNKTYGWDEFKGRNLNSKNPEVMIVGDSFTYGDEVEEQDTWPYLFSKKIGFAVKNEGVRAFGLDQTVLKTEELLKNKAAANTVILAIIGDGLNRNLTVYWPFLSVHSHTYLTKPRFQLSSAGIELLPNVVTNERELSNLKDENFLRRIGAFDYWYKLKAPMATPSFPYSQVLISKNFYMQIKYKAKEFIDNHWLGKRDLWNERDVTHIQDYLIERFFTAVRQAGKTPILMYLPVKEEIEAYLRTGELSFGGMNHTQEFCHRNEYRCLFPLLEMKGQIQKENLGEYFQPRSHYSPKMNSFIAEYLSQYF